MPSQDDQDEEIAGLKERKQEKEAVAAGNTTTTNTTTHNSQSRSWFAIPPPIRYLFDRTPLITYSSNQLPIRSPRHEDQNVLYIFTTQYDAARGVPSHNPGCLKWQTLLKFYEIPFTTALSTNHASPTGALPFLLPADYSKDIPITAATLPTYLRTHTTQAPRQSSPDTHLVLLHPIRLAYLHALYLHPQTFDTSTRALYIDPTSSNTLVRDVQSHYLRSSAWDEVTRDRNERWPVVDGDSLRNEAIEAFKALGTILGDRDWYGQAKQWSEDSEHDARGQTTKSSGTSHGSEKNKDIGSQDADDTDEQVSEAEQIPGMLDAAVFSYTHIILSICASEPQLSPAARLAKGLKSVNSLVAHRERVLERFYGNAP